MENFNQNQIFPDSRVENLGSRTISQSFFSNVFLWMFAGLGISALLAFVFAANPQLLQFMISPTGRPSILGMLVIFAPFIMVMTMSLAFSRLSVVAISALFVVFSALMGISLSFVLLAYTASSVVGCFISAAAMFGVMAVMGYTTKKDLTSFGRILSMAVIGLIVAMLFNWFMHSAALDYIISIIGVMVFVGLTAYDVQTLKRIGAGLEYEGVPASDVKKLSIMGALRLYIDFINIFLFLIQIFGKRKD